MRKSTPRLYALVLAATLLACARLAGIEDPDPAESSGAASGNPDGSMSQSGAGLKITPESINITTSCNVSGTPQFLTLENQGTTEAPYELQVPEGSAFALRDGSDASTLLLKGVLRPTGVVLAYVEVTSPKAGTFNGVVIARVGDQTKQIPVSVTVTGGSLSLSPTLVDFGEVRKDTTSSPQTIEIQNTGTEPVNVIGFDAVGAPSPDFAIATTAGSVNIPAGGKTTATATLVTGKEGPPLTATFAPRPQSPTCGALPTVTLKGTRVNQDVTVNPVALDFGEVDCASPGGATRTVTISNYGSSAVPFTATTPANSWFTATPVSGSVPKETGGNPGTATVTIALKPVGSVLGDHTDTIDIVVTAPVPKTTTITASAESVGAVLEINPTVLSNFSPNGTKSFGVRNVGNKFVYVQHQSTEPLFGVSPSTSPLYPGFLALRVDVTFGGSGSTNVSGDVTTTRIDTPRISLFPSSGRLCTPAPAVIVRSGN